MPRGASFHLAASWNEGKQPGGQRPCGVVVVLVVGGGEGGFFLKDDRSENVVSSNLYMRGRKHAVSGGGMFNEIWWNRSGLTHVFILIFHVVAFCDPPGSSKCPCESPSSIWAFSVICPGSWPACHRGKPLALLQSLEQKDTWHR